MAEVIVTPFDSRLGVRFIHGQDPEGRDILRARSWGRIKAEAEDQAVYDTGVALATLCVHDVEDYRRYDTAELSE